MGQWDCRFEVKYLYILNLNERCTKINILNYRSSVTMPESRIGSIEAFREKDNAILIHLINGKTFELNTIDMTMSESVKFPEFCDYLVSTKEHIIGLASSGRLYVDGKEIISAISSFAIHSDFLLVTSLQKHRLLCFPLARLSNQDLAITERAIERGAKLVHTVATNTTVVLQMPRGNLEAIHPRALSLNIMKSLIDRLVGSK